MLREISAPELSQRLNAGEALFLLDVREPWEFERAQIAGSTLVPMNQIVARLAELDPRRETVVVCHHGQRSFQVGLFLARSGFSNVVNLRGGVDAWSQQVDLQLPRY
jgi:rhodanese-related sulfurtransferase